MTAVPEVSILLPTCDRPRYVAETIRSVQEQTFRDWELIVVDSSGEETAGLIGSFLGDGRIVYLHQPRRGIPAAKNAALERARGPWIANIESDDVWLPDILETFLQEAGRRRDADIVYGDAVHIDADGREIGRRSIPPLREDLVAQLIEEGNLIPMTASLIRKSLFDRFGRFDESYFDNEQYDFWVFAASHGARFHHLPRPVVRLRYHPDSASHEEALFSDRLRFAERLLKEYPRLRRACWRNLGATLDEYGQFKAERGRRREALADLLRSLYYSPWAPHPYWHFAKYAAAWAAAAMRAKDGV